MSKLQLIMLLNTANDKLCDYYPNDFPKNFIKQIKEIASTFKSSKCSGIVYTQSKYKYYYYHYNNTSLFSPMLTDDHLFIFLAADSKYSTSKIEELFTHMQSSINKNSYLNFKISKDTKESIVKLFNEYKYDKEKKLTINNTSLSESHEDSKIQWDMILKQEKVSFSNVEGFSKIEWKSKTKGDQDVSGINDKVERKKVDMWKKEKIFYSIIMGIIILILIVAFLLLLL